MKQDLTAFHIRYHLLCAWGEGLRNVPLTGARREDRERQGKKSDNYFFPLKFRPFLKHAIRLYFKSAGNHIFPQPHFLTSWKHISEDV